VKHSVTVKKTKKGLHWRSQEKHSRIRCKKYLPRMREWKIVLSLVLNC